MFSIRQKWLSFILSNYFTARQGFCIASANEDIRGKKSLSTTNYEDIVQLSSTYRSMLMKIS